MKNSADRCGACPFSRQEKDTVCLSSVQLAATCLDSQQASLTLVDLAGIGTNLALSVLMTNRMPHSVGLKNDCIAAGTEPVVLVVEDDPDTREFMTRALKAEGMSCLSACSVEEAIAILQEQRVTVTVLDWGLDRSGSEVLSVAKELHPAMPVVAISGLPFEVRTDAVVNQADAFLNKPFSATVLTGQVKQLIARVVRQQVPCIPLPQRSEDIVPLNQIEAAYIRHVLQLLDGNKSKAAEALQIHRQTVSAALKQQDNSAN